MDTDRVPCRAVAGMGKFPAAGMDTLPVVEDKVPLCPVEMVVDMDTLLVLAAGMDKPLVVVDMDTLLVLAADMDTLLVLAADRTPLRVVMDQAPVENTLSGSSLINFCEQ